MILFALLNLYIFKGSVTPRQEGMGGGGEVEGAKGGKKPKKNKLVREGWIKLHVILEEGHWLKL